MVKMSNVNNFQQSYNIKRHVSTRSTTMDLGLKPWLNDAISNSEIYNMFWEAIYRWID